ncbi:unnamed protein product [Rhodiola kirilowii]
MANLSSVQLIEPFIKQWTFTIDPETLIDNQEPITSSALTGTNEPVSSPQYPILHLTFNQDHTCFSAITNHGYDVRVYKCEPFLEQHIFTMDPGADIRAVEMLFRSNSFALLPQYPTTVARVMLVCDDPDDERERFDKLYFTMEVKAVRLRGDEIVLVFLQNINVYTRPVLKPLHQIRTVHNPKGLCEVSQISRLLVCPGVHKGQVRVEHYGLKRTVFIEAHSSTIACLALTTDGRFLATSGSKGSLIRLFNTSDGSLLQELRRGTRGAEIHSLAFSSTAQWLAVSSDRGTVHVFRLSLDSGNERPESPETKPSSSSALSPFSFIRGVLPKYFQSQRSVAQIHLPKGCPYIVAFGHQQNTIVVVGMDGSFIRCQFDPVNGGNMTQIECRNFLPIARRSLITDTVTNF